MGLQSRTRLITCILTSGRKHTLSSQGPPWGRCKMCMCWGFQGSKQSRCCWHTQMKTYVTREIREDCLEEAVPKPGPNLARGKCFREVPWQGQPQRCFRSRQSQPGQDPVESLSALMVGPLWRGCDEQLECGPRPSSIPAPGTGGFHAELTVKPFPNPLQSGVCLPSGQSWDSSR